MNRSAFGQLDSAGVLLGLTGVPQACKRPRCSEKRGAAPTDRLASRDEDRLARFAEAGSGGGTLNRAVVGV